MCCSRTRICRQENEDKNYTNQHAAMRMHAGMSVYTEMQCKSGRLKSV